MSYLSRFLISFFLFLILILSLPNETVAQSDACRVRISMLTCSPGEELYSTFGHSALRITDSSNNEDIVYNYGTFNFDEPGFYRKFVLGKLMYYLSTEDFISFKTSYQQEKRSMIEQVLNLSCKEKHKMMLLLHQNLQGENKFYTYDFLFDNCTTRLRDLLENTGDPAVRFSKVVKGNTTFRQHIFEYMEYNNHQWTKLGMDILLGNVTDNVMDNREAMFLPDYLLKGFDSAKLGSKSAVQSKNVVINFPDQRLSENLTSGEKPNNNFSHPFFVFTVLLIIIAVVGIISRLTQNQKVKILLNGFDGILFFMAGIAGILMLFMWFCTDHMVCKNNYNLLWAWPTHAIAAFFIQSKKKWVKKYFLVTAIAGALLLLFWAFLPQPLSVVLIPIQILLIIRSIHFLFENRNNGKQIPSI